MILKKLVDNLQHEITERSRPNIWCITNQMVLGNNVFLVFNGVKYSNYGDVSECILEYVPSDEAKLNFMNLGDSKKWLLQLGVFYKNGKTELEIITPFDVLNICATNNLMSLDNNFTIINTAVWNMSAPPRNAKA